VFTCVFITLCPALICPESVAETVFFEPETCLESLETKTPYPDASFGKLGLLAGCFLILRFASRQRFLTEVRADKTFLSQRF
jgi:hypothetical protein